MNQEEFKSDGATIHASFIEAGLLDEPQARALYHAMQETLKTSNVTEYLSNFDTNKDIKFFTKIPAARSEFNLKQDPIPSGMGRKWAGALFLLHKSIVFSRIVVDRAQMLVNAKVAPALSDAFPQAIKLTLTDMADAAHDEYEMLLEKRPTETAVLVSPAASLGRLFIESIFSDDDKYIEKIAGNQPKSNHLQYLAVYMERKGHKDFAAPIAVTRDLLPVLSTMHY